MYQTDSQKAITTLAKNLAKTATREGLEAALLGAVEVAVAYSDMVATASAELEVDGAVSQNGINCLKLATEKRNILFSNKIFEAFGVSDEDGHQAMYETDMELGTSYTTN